MRDPSVTKRAVVEPVLPEVEMDGEGTDDTEDIVAVRFVIHESEGREGMMLWDRRRKGCGIGKETKERTMRDVTKQKGEKRKVRIASVVYTRGEIPGVTHHQTRANLHPLSSLLVSLIVTSYIIRADRLQTARQASPTLFSNFSLLDKTPAAVCDSLDSSIRISTHTDLEVVGCCFSSARILWVHHAFLSPVSPLNLTVPKGYGSI